MSLALVLVAVVILLAVFFTYTNGFQDGSSVTASAIASRAMTPMQAIILASCCELAGAIFGGSAVSGTIQAITSWPAQANLLPVLVSGLIAAIVWNYTTRALKVPSSSTHALVGGVIGALYAGGGAKYLILGNVSLVHPSGIWKVILTIFVSPLVGLLAGYLVLEVFLLLLSRATMRINRSLKALQWAATAVLAFAHGANDPQKTMGLIMLALHAIGWNTGAGIPLWVRLVTGIFMAFGVAALSQGIVKRVGSGIYKMRVVHGLAAETASAGVVLFASITGGPVSASQVISSSVMGVGSAARVKGVHWLVAKDMLLAWFLTIPCSAAVSFLLHVTLVHWLDRYL